MSNKSKKPITAIVGVVTSFLMWTTIVAVVWASLAGFFTVCWNLFVPSLGGPAITFIGGFGALSLLILLIGLLVTAFRPFGGKP